MRITFRLLIVLAVVAGLTTGPAQAERRLALSIGIDVYDNLPAAQQLQKAVNDARAVGATLQELGFDTTVEENPARLAFTRLWQRFLNRLEPGDTAALFFAGHGVEISGLNYLLPRDVPKVAAGEDKVLAAASIRFNELMEDLRERKVRVALLIVDACRDNPFRDSAGRSVGGTRGLVRVEPAEGTFVMYSAGAGEQALDRLPGADASPNSVYTRTLLPILKTPGLSLPEIAGRVRTKVVDAARGAGHKQTPAYYDQIVGQFLLKVGPASDVKSLPPAPPPSAVSGDVERAWAAAKDSASIAVLEAFRKEYGSKSAFYDRLAQARIADLRKQQQPQPSASLIVLKTAAGFARRLDAMARVGIDRSSATVTLEVPSGTVVALMESGRRLDWIGLGLCRRTTQGWEARGGFVTVRSKIGAHIGLGESLSVFALRANVPLPPDDPTLSQHWLCVEMGRFDHGQPVTTYSHAADSCSKVKVCW